MVFAVSGIPAIPNLLVLPMSPQDWLSAVYTFRVYVMLAPLEKLLTECCLMARLGLLSVRLAAWSDPYPLDYWPFPD